MAKLTFTNDSQKGSLSSEFKGGVNIQCIFAGGGRHVIFIESKIGSDMPWSVLRNVVVKEQDVFSIPEAAKEQLFRFFTDCEPISAETSAISGGADSIGPSDIIEPGTNSDGKVNTVEEVIKVFKDFPEDMTVQEAIGELMGGGLQDEDIENIFYPKEVTGITADESGELVILNLVGNNIEEDDAIDWTMEMEGVEKELSGVGTTLTLSAEDSAEYRAANNVSAKVSIGEYDSESFTLKTM